MTYNAEHIYASSTITYDGTLTAIVGVGPGPDAGVLGDDVDVRVIPDAPVMVAP